MHKKNENNTLKLSTSSSSSSIIIILLILIKNSIVLSKCNENGNDDQVEINGICCPKYSILVIDDDDSNNRGECRCKANEEVQNGRCRCKTGYHSVGIGNNCCRLDQIWHNEFACQCPNGFVEVENRCQLAPDDFFDNNDVALAKNMCPCPISLEYDSINHQCKCPEGQEYSEISRTCECKGINNEFKGSLCCSKDQEMSIVTGKCTCPLGMILSTSDEVPNRCICPDNKENSEKHPHLCCDKTLEYVNNAQCECKGDLVKNSNNQCACPINSYEVDPIENPTRCCLLTQIYDKDSDQCKCAPNRRFFGTKCCALDQVEDKHGNCVCEGNLIRKIFDDSEEAEIGDPDDHDYLCKCPGSKTLLQPGLCCTKGQVAIDGTCMCTNNREFDSKTQRCVCPIGMTEIQVKLDEDDERDDDKLDYDSIGKASICCAPGQFYDKASKSCKCPGNLTVGIYGCQCQADEVMHNNGTQCCRLDQQFNAINQQCECKPPLVDFNNKCICLSSHDMDDDDDGGGVAGENNEKKCCNNFDNYYINIDDDDDNNSNSNKSNYSFNYYYSDKLGKCLKCNSYNEYFSIADGKCHKCGYGYTLEVSKLNMNFNNNNNNNNNNINNRNNEGSSHQRNANNSYNDYNDFIDININNMNRNSNYKRLCVASVHLIVFYYAFAGAAISTFVLMSVIIYKMR